MKRPRRIALIPAFEPDEKLVELVKELKENSFEIVIINDGSGKECQEVLTAVSNTPE